MYLLLAGSPAYCSHHAPIDTGPDDFDIPLWDEEPEFREPVLQRRKFVWTDKNGDDHKLKDIDDYYLNNIINFLKRQNNEAELGRTIKFLEKEVRVREKEKASGKS